MKKPDIARRLKGALLGHRGDARVTAGNDDEHAAVSATVSALMVVVRDLETSMTAVHDRLHDLERDLAAARRELAASRADHAALRDEYRSLTRARDRLARQYRELAGQQPAAAPPPDAEAMSASEAYDTFVDFVEFCKHVGVRPPQALPDYMR